MLLGELPSVGPEGSSEKSMIPFISSNLMSTTGFTAVGVACVIGGGMLVIFFLVFDFSFLDTGAGGGWICGKVVVK